MAFATVFPEEAMSDTRRLIEEYFDAFNRQDAEGLLDLLAEDVVHDINEGPREIGRDRFRDFKRHMDECYREQIDDLVVMTDGRHGAAEFIVNGEYIKTDAGLPVARGQRYSIPAAAFFEVEGGRISRVTSYYNLKGWIGAVSQ